MKSTAKPSSACNRRTFSRMLCCTTTSSPVVGSSSTTNLGPMASASARLIRCRIPPDSSCGNAVMNFGSISTMSNRVLIRSVTSLPRNGVWHWMTSANCASTRVTGFREFMLLWKTVEISRQRYLRNSSWLRCAMSVPSKVMDPPLIRPGRSSNLSTAMPTVVLPDPDSPIRPTNSPSSMLKLR